MYKILIFLSLFSVNISAQINSQFLIENWTKTKTRLLDGSKDLSEPYLSSKFFQWKFSNNKFCMNSEPIFYSQNNCIDYKLEKNIIKTSPYSGYEIEKLTIDSLIVIERMEGVTTNDKIKKLWFVRTSNLKNSIIERTKNDSVVIANEHFTPTLNKNFITEINEEFKKVNKTPNFNVIGEIVFFPKKQKIELLIKNTDNLNKYEKFIQIEKSVIENSFSNWNLKDFMRFDKIYLPIILQTQYYSIDKDWSYKGSRVFYFTNNVEDITKIQGIKAEDMRDAGKNFNNGISSYQDKKYDKALLYFQKSYELDNRNIDALYNIIAIYSLKNDNSNACKILKLLNDLEQTEGAKLFNQNCKK